MDNEQDFCTYLAEVLPDNNEFRSKVINALVSDVFELDLVQFMTFIENMVCKPIAPETKSWVDATIERVKGIKNE